MENKEIIKEVFEQSIAVFESLHSAYCTEEADREYHKWLNEKVDELNKSNYNGSKFQTILMAFSQYVAINTTPKSSLVGLKNEFISSGHFDKAIDKMENSVSLLDKLFGALEKSLMKEEKEKEKKEIVKLEDEEEKTTLKNIIYQIYLKQDEGEKFNISILAKEQMKELNTESKKRISSILVNLGNKLRDIDSFDKASSIVEEYCK